jgi:glycosyltransferase involved in cell wall biosynthesis
MLILFVRNGHAFLPEVQAYMNFFSSTGIACEEVLSKTSSRIQYDVEWHMMGIDRDGRNHGVCKIHDYASASVPPFRTGKNRLKKWFNALPDYRLFLNEYVKQQFGFEDDLPFGFRDMGVNDEPTLTTESKEHDFIYVGEVGSLRHGFARWISAFTDGPLKGRSLLVVSKSYETLAARLNQYGNIHFVGPVPHAQVRKLISRARFALNFVPDIEPFNRQTSTKLLEYASAGVPIVTTDYKWVRDFQDSHGGEFFYVAPDLANFRWDSITSFSYQAPELADYRWETQIRRSGVLEFLQSRFPDSTASGLVGNAAMQPHAAVVTGHRR